jgi:hypothetical protein
MRGSCVLSQCTSRIEWHRPRRCEGRRRKAGDGDTRFGGVVCGGGDALQLRWETHTALTMGLEG